MARLAHLEREGVGPAHLDRLGVHEQGLPPAVELGRGLVVVQPLDVQVLDVAGDDREAPGVVPGRPDQDPRRERESDPARLVRRGAQVGLEPGGGLLHQQVRDRSRAGVAARGPRAGDDPVVRALAARPREPVEQVLGERASPAVVAAVSSADPGRAGRQERVRAGPMRSDSRSRSSSRSQLPESPQAMYANAAAQASRSSGRSGSTARSRARAAARASRPPTPGRPSTNRRIIASESWLQRPISRAPIRWKPTVRANRSAGMLTSPNHPASRPFAARSARLDLEQPLEACTNPWANQRSSRESADR